MSETTNPGRHTLLELLRQQAHRYRDKDAFRFSYNGDGENESQLSYGELDLQARAVAARLQQQGAAGRRVLVLCRPGLDGIAGIFGCVYSGAIAVPIHERLAPRLSSVVPDSQADFVVAPADTPAKFSSAMEIFAGGRRLSWCLTDASHREAKQWVAPELNADAPVLIQYTSGSIKAPKGVMLAHRRLLHNVAALSETFGGYDANVFVSWLPQHHDMGLIGCGLYPLHIGATTILMAPAAAVRRPMRWLELISRHRGTVTFAPDSAYQRCVETSSAEERATLDLSSLAIAVNGAEPVRTETLRNFADAFGSAGFRPEAFRPAYGLAESTLLVSGGSAAALPTIEHLDRAELGHDRVLDAEPGQPTTTAVVGCGHPQGGQRVVIVDPDTRRTCAAGEVGELWITGLSVAQEYWNNPGETEQTFAACLAGAGEGPFLRTGDMGFLRAGEVFITGRLKDLVDIDGCNHYPNDIENIVQRSHPLLLSGRGAVFAIPAEAGSENKESSTGNKLVVTQEVERDTVNEIELGEVVDAIQPALAASHQTRAGTVVLVAHLSIPTTSSGKIQRRRCRQQFLDGDLNVLAEWNASPQSGGDRRATDMTATEFVANIAETKGPQAAAEAVAILKTAAAHKTRASSR